MISFQLENATDYLLVATQLIAVSALLCAAVHWGIAKFLSVKISSRIAENDKDGIRHQAYAPKAVVLLSLRGLDPFLEDTIKGLLSQTYAYFEIVVAVDHRHDEAWHVVEQTQAVFDTQQRLRLYEMQAPRKTCSLKCSSLLEAFGHISPDREVAVLIDADVVPHATWLQDVVRPLADETIGVVTGNQWFSPETDSCGAVLRSIWNAGAIVSTAFNENPWAGTCAMRISDIQASGLLEQWKSSVVDDGPIKSAMASIGKRVVFEPKLIMVNRDQCSLSYVNRYVARMLTWSRLYEPSFIGTAAHAAAVLGLLTASTILLLACAFMQEWKSLTLLGTALLLSHILVFRAFYTIRRAVEQAVAHRSERLTPWTIRRVVTVSALLIVCYWAHPFWTFEAIFVRRVSWRQITYRLRGGHVVEMEEYRPYTSEASDGSIRKHSV